MQRLESAPIERRVDRWLGPGDRLSKHRGSVIERLGDNPISARFCDRLAGDSALTPPERLELLKLPTHPVLYSAGQTVAADFEPVPAALVLSGWMSAQRVLEDGERQIFDLVVPGDAIGLSQRSSKPFSLSLVALTDVLAVDGSELRRSLATRVPGFGQALSWIEQRSECRLYEHIERLGRRKSYERLASLFLDLHTRLADAGCINGLRFPFPLTQEVLADFLGLTSIHVNRTLRQLRGDGLIKIASGFLEIGNIEWLRAAAGDTELSRMHHRQQCAPIIAY